MTFYQFVHMLRRGAAAVVVLFVVAVNSSQTFGATVTFLLDTSDGPGQFSLYGITSAGDNAGLAIYGVSLSGNVLTLDNVSPVLQFGQKGSFSGGGGFNQVRSPDITLPTVNPVVSAGQDFTNAGAPGNLVYGIGQTSGSFAADGWNPLFPGPEPQSWNYPVLLATGTYSGFLSFNLQSPDLVANVFAAQGQAAVPSATVVTRGSCIDCVQVGGATIDNVDPNNPGMVMATLTASSDAVFGPYSWTFFGDVGYTPAPGASGSGPTVLPTLDPATGKFSWNTVGSPLGTYTWTVLAKGIGGGGLGGITVKLVAVPEPATAFLIYLATLGSLGLVRRRR